MSDYEEDWSELIKENERLKSALEPFAAIGRKINATDETVWPRGAKARFLNLDGLTVRHFCDAGRALREQQSDL